MELVAIFVLVLLGTTCVLVLVELAIMGESRTLDAYVWIVEQVKKKVTR